MTQNQYPPPLPGSWEAAIQEADALAQKGDDRAVELFHKYRERLLRFGPERRQANRGQLQATFEYVTFRLFKLLYERERFLEAAELYGAEMRGEFSEVPILGIEYCRSLALAMAGREGEARTILEELLISDPESEEVLNDLFQLYVYSGEYDTADSLLDAKFAWLSSRDLIRRAEQIDRHITHRYASTLAAVRSEWDLAIDHLKETQSSIWDGLLMPSPHYLRLLEAGEHETLRSHLQEDTHEIRRHFWQGMIHSLQGEESAAKDAWSQAKQVDLDEIVLQDFTEWALSHFYLGDEERIALQFVLRLIQRFSKEELDPAFVALAGLGWAIQGQDDKLKSNLYLARKQSLFLLNRGQIGWDIGFHVKRLIGEERFKEVAGAFDPVDFGEFSRPLPLGEGEDGPTPE